MLWGYEATPSYDGVAFVFASAVGLFYHVDFVAWHVLKKATLESIDETIRFRPAASISRHVNHPRH